MTLDWNAASKLAAAYVRFPTANLPDVAAVALRLPENTSVVRTLVPGLNCKVASLETATPDAVAFTGLNNK